MTVVCVNKEKAEQVKKYLVMNNLFDRGYLPQRYQDKVLFPVIAGKERLVKKQFPAVQIIPFALERTQVRKTPYELLKQKLTTKQHALLPQTYEQIGDILILELPEELHAKEQLIGEAFLQGIPSAKTVVRKSALHSGVYRTRKVKHLAGAKKTETIHRESGVAVKLDIEKVYFSARLSEERLRLARQIKKGERILVMFSGSGIYPLVLAKNSPVKEVMGVELNPVAHHYALDNRMLNQLEKKVHILVGDASVVVPKLKGTFDRIAMPLPKTGELFLPVAIRKIKPGGIIHLYHFVNENELNQEKKKISDIIKSLKHSYRIIRVVQCGSHAPHIYRYCFDIKVLGKK